MKVMELENKADVGMKDVSADVLVHNDNDLRRVDKTAAASVETCDWSVPRAAETAADAVGNNQRLTKGLSQKSKLTPKKCY